MLCDAKGCRFSPPRFLVAAGTTIEVVNRADQPHTFTDAAGRFDWAIEPGNIVRFRPRAGTYVIHDQTDPGVRGRMQVQA